MRCQMRSMRFCVPGRETPRAAPSNPARSARRSARRCRVPSSPGPRSNSKAAPRRHRGRPPCAGAPWRRCAWHEAPPPRLPKRRRRSLADDDVTVAVLAQPLHPVLGGDAPIHDHPRAGRRVQRLEHAGQRLRFLDVAREHPLRRTNPLPSSTRPSVNSGQSLRFSFECPRRAFGWSAAPPSKRVRQVVQRHRRGGVEQIHRGVLNRCDSMASRCLISASEARYNCIAPSRLEIHAQNSPRALRSPNQAWVPFGGRIRQPPDDRARRRGAQRAVDAPTRSTTPPAPVARGPTARPAPRRGFSGASTQANRHPPPARRAPRPSSGARASRCAPMRCASHSTSVVRCPPGQRRLTESGSPRCANQDRPVNLGQIEPRTEVEQGALADLLAVAFAAHQPMGVVRAPFGAAGHGAANEHESNDKRRRMRRQDPSVTLWHAIAYRLHDPYRSSPYSTRIASDRPNRPPSATFLVKMG